MKIDVEGAELFVLEGARDTLETFRPRLIVEIFVETFSAAGYSTEDLLDFLSGQSYRFFSIRRSGTTRLAEEVDIISDPGPTNVLCVPS